ncbi:head-tail connector protein [Chromobacterium violaceum]|uniref:head-tail connector protein n=1 Tax=Chromobacterium violaceum TaxID=536 RepID=UPI001E488893|nr:head-tail connector protein [Chromobacterium violaceum]MCD0494828.1 head-tail connector protein [Chromobacterium violaceum]
MQLFPDLSLVRLQCRIDQDLTEDDPLLRLYVAAAVSLAEQALGQSLATQWPKDEDVPEAIKQWVLLRVATAYAQREAVASGQPLQQLPRTFVDGLLDPWRVYR